MICGRGPEPHHKDGGQAVQDPVPHRYGAGGGSAARMAAPRLGFLSKGVDRVDFLG
jgi:hypothetical protein